MDRIRGRTALITGASAGIGEACARTLAAAGADLVVTARRRGRLEALRDELEAEHGVRVRVEPLDVRRRTAVQELARRLRADDVFVEILVNNAGLGRGVAPLHEGDPDHWDEMIDTNLKGLLYVTRAFLPRMVGADRGHVVFMGSLSGFEASPDNAVYSATKFGVRGLTEAVNIDLLGTRVRVTGIEPGMVETEFSRVRAGGDDEAAARHYEGFTPLSPGDVADAVRYAVAAPEHVDVLHMVILGTDQRSTYHVHREEGRS